MVSQHSKKANILHDLFILSIYFTYLFACLFVYLCVFLFDPSTSQAACIGWDVLKRIPKQIPKGISLLEFPNGYKSNSKPWAHWFFKMLSKLVDSSRNSNKASTELSMRRRPLETLWSASNTRIAAELNPWLVTKIQIFRRLWEAQYGAVSLPRLQGSQQKRSWH